MPQKKCVHHYANNVKEEILKSNLIDIQGIKTATYSNKAYFPGELFYIFEKLNVFVKHCSLSLSLS